MHDVLSSPDLHHKRRKLENSSPESVRQFNLNLSRLFPIMGTSAPSPVKEDKHIYILAPGITHADLVKRGKMAINLNEEDIALFYTKDQIYAVQAKCPHAGGPLHQGDIEELPNKSTCIKCPWHQWQFNLRTGECVFPGNRPNERLHTFPVKVTDGQIRVGFEKIALKYFKSLPT